MTTSETADPIAPQATTALLARLTPRELEVLRAAASGRSIRETADALGIGWRTVSTHLQGAYAALGIRVGPGQCIGRACYLLGLADGRTHAND